MASQGPLSPVSVTSVAYGTVAWTNPSDAVSENSTYATASFTTGETTSEYLFATDFGFSIPSDANIIGIVAEFIRRAQSDDDAVVRDESVRIVSGGFPIGSDKSSENDWYTGTGTETKSFGGSADLWSSGLTVANINSSTFGVAIACKLRFTPVFSSPCPGYVDHVRLTVYYEPQPSGDFAVSTTAATCAFVGTYTDPTTMTGVFAVTTEAATCAFSGRLDPTGLIEPTTTAATCSFAGSVWTVGNLAAETTAATCSFAGTEADPPSGTFSVTTTAASCAFAGTHTAPTIITGLFSVTTSRATCAFAGTVLCFNPASASFGGRIDSEPTYGGSIDYNPTYGGEIEVNSWVGCS